MYLNHEVIYCRTTNDNVVIMENSDHSTLTKTNAEEYIQSIATDPNLRGMLYHNLLHRNMIMNSRSQKVWYLDHSLS